MEIANFGIFSDILQFCQNSLELEVKTALNLKDECTATILKRNKNLNKGHFVGIIHEWKVKMKGKNKQSPDTGTEHVPSEIYSDDIARCHDKCAPDKVLNTLETHPFKTLLPFSIKDIEVTPDFDIYFKFDQMKVYSTVISEVLRKGDDYGHHAKNGPSKKACINVAYLSENADWTGFSVSHLRSLLLSEHIAALLKANGYFLDYVQYPVKEEWRKNITNAGLSCAHFHVEPSQDRENSIKAKTDELHEFFSKSRHLERTYNGQEGAHRICDTVCDGLNVESGNVKWNATVINLRNFLEENHIDKLYNKNINLVDFSKTSDKLQDLVILEHHRRMKQEVYDIVVHVTPHERSFYIQTVDIGWRMINHQKQSDMKHIYVEHGPVTSRGGQLPVSRADDFFSLRLCEMKAASVMKYGDMVEGVGWEGTIHSLTVAAVKFEILSTTCRLPVKLDLSELDEVQSTMDSRSGIFVMYNCARLANLFSNFDKAVHEGKYPDLPDIDSLNFNLLREEDEWALMFNYVLLYPSLVQECVASVQSNATKPLIHTHKITHFLQDLCKYLSSYYSRVHVLTEPREHLLPLMYCRLYLLKSVQQVIHNALSLLSIQPLAQL